MGDEVPDDVSSLDVHDGRKTKLGVTEGGNVFHQAPCGADYRDGIAVTDQKKLITCPGCKGE